MDENSQHTPGAGHEETDIDVWAVGKFAVALVLAGIAVAARVFARLDPSTCFSAAFADAGDKPLR